MIEKINKWESLLGGFGASIFLGFTAIVIGLIISLTIIGSIIGVPMMIAGGLIIFPGSLIIPFILKSSGMIITCPYCKHKNKKYLTGLKAFNCAMCRKRILAVNNKVSLVAA